MFFIKHKFHKINCINGCTLFEDMNNYSYWESNKVTSDEKEIINFLNLDNLCLDKKILHVGIGNSFLTQSLKNYKSIDGITISNNELLYGYKLNLPNYNIFFKNKYAYDNLINNKENYYDIIIDINLKSFSCCDFAFEDLIAKYRRYLKSGGYIITSLNGMSWSRIIKPVISFSFRKLFYKRLKEFNGPSVNKMSLKDCENLSKKNKFLINLRNNNLILFEKIYE